MFKNEIFELYKKSGMTINEISAEYSMILDYLSINALKEIKDGLSGDEKEKIINIVKKRTETGMPLQYIVGFGYFMGKKFFVNQNTLIPRPETEILVRECAKLVTKNIRVLDIGTGSGCIAIGLSKLTGAKVDGIDISNEALIIARKNAKLHNVDCNFFYSDLFTNVGEKYDFIVSNPPYIPISTIDTLEEHVKNFEPHAALFANDEFGIEYYKKIIEQSFTFLNKNGYLCFEAGLNQAGRISEILLENGFNDIRVVKDFDNTDRVIIAKFCKKHFAI